MNDDLLRHQLDLMRQRNDMSDSQRETLKRVMADIVSGELGGRISLGYPPPKPSCWQRLKRRLHRK